ncbi:uncharacterized protein J4E79_007755 [Alternaria viburni]|uniref:uncharacterized protein n=1 Tax=Alternaria viburni TaxID=566460 RepID=UPI0020C43E0A|nr:uncharacterized protein J4E79_007755 [Alternaria viburni]KAI4657139.1 hypothetical protein J4E79_007755 [Alternaria viburni]
MPSKQKERKSVYLGVTQGQIGIQKRLDWEEKVIEFLDGQSEIPNSRRKYRNEEEEDEEDEEEEEDMAYPHESDSDASDSDASDPDELDSDESDRMSLVEDT